MAISSGYANTSVTNHYPSDILSDENIYRSIQIIVKYQEEWSGGINSIVDKITEAASDFSKAYDDLTSDKVSPADAAKQKKLSNRKPSPSNLSTTYGIALPLPNELNDSQTHQWESSEGIIASVASSITNASVANVSVNKAIGDLASAAGFRKPIIDPGYFQDYKGSEPREFSFSWDLIPTNAEEADQIMTIIYNLKKYTLPRTSVTGLSLTSPFLFDIKMGNQRINEVINMNDVVCKSMNVNFASEGSLQFHPDGIPKQIRLEMTFAERTLVTSDFY